MSWRQKTVSAVAKALGVGAYGGAFDKPGFGATASGLTRPYEQSTWIQAALNLVTQPIKSVPLKFYQGDVEVEDATLKAFFRAPALGMSRDEWLDSTGGWSKLAGEFFWILDDTWLVRRGVKSPLLVGRPTEMRQIIVGGELVGWEYRDGEGRRIPLIPEQVITRKRWNPWNRWRGLGELSAAKLAAETDYLAGQFARDSYANAGDQGDDLATDGPAPTAEQQAQIVAALREKKAARLRGEFRPMFYTGGLKKVPSGVTGPDANMVANRLQSRHEVFIAFGVPASMADVQASYSIGSASDYFRLIHGTCMPLANTIAEAASILARRLTGLDITAEFDWDEHPVMQAVRSERIEAATKLFALGVPLEAANDYLDMGLKPVPGWDQGWLPFSLQPAGEALPAAPAEDGTNGTNGTNDAVEVMLRELEARAGKARKAKATGDGGQETGCIHCMPGEARNPKWIAHWRSRQETIKTYEGKFNRQLMRARAEVLGKIKAAEGKAAATKAVAADLNFDLEDWSDGLVIEMNKAGRTAMDKAGRQAKAEIGAADDAWTMPPAKAVEHLRKRENYLRDVADSVHQAVEEQLIEGISAGETMQELAERVRAQFNKISAARARTIASTETAAAYGYARQEAFKQSGVAWKQWLTSGNDNVRDTHAAAEGQRRKIEEPFTVGRASLMHPGDDSLGAPPEETINCHCVSIAVENGDDQ